MELELLLSCTLCVAVIAQGSSSNSSPSSSIGYTAWGRSCHHIHWVGMRAAIPTTTTTRATPRPGLDLAHEEPCYLDPAQNRRWVWHLCDREAEKMFSWVFALLATYRSSFLVVEISEKSAGNLSWKWNNTGVQPAAANSLLLSAPSPDEVILVGGMGGEQWLLHTSHSLRCTGGAVKDSLWLSQTEVSWSRVQAKSSCLCSAPQCQGRFARCMPGREHVTPGRNRTKAFAHSFYWVSDDLLV